MADDDPWGGMEPLHDFPVTIHRCSTCHMAFVNRRDCTRHTALPACRGATVKTKVCPLSGKGYVRTRRARQCKTVPGAGPITISHSTTIQHIEHVDTINIIVGDELGDLVRSGSITESELIQRTILENADLRRQVRTIENIPAAVFRVTKGTGGPRQLRNVRRNGGRVAELEDDDVKHSATVEYCKATALKMLRELQTAIQSVDACSPEAVREWARDVAKALEEKAYGRFDYPTVLRLYADASGKFYKLPKQHRDAVSAGVMDIAMFIAQTADF